MMNASASLVLLVGVAEQLAVDNDEVISDSRGGEGVENPVARHQVDLRIPLQLQPAREVVLHGVDVGELPAREPHRRSPYACAGELAIQDQARHEEQQRNEGRYNYIDHGAR